jgi:hypothetical protein
MTDFIIMLNSYEISFLMMTNGLQMRNGKITKGEVPGTPPHSGVGKPSGLPFYFLPTDRARDQISMHFRDS